MSNKLKKQNQTEEQANVNTEEVVDEVTDEEEPEEEEEEVEEEPKKKARKKAAKKKKSIDWQKVWHGVGLGVGKMLGTLLEAIIMGAGSALGIIVLGKALSKTQSLGGSSTKGLPGSEQQALTTSAPTADMSSSASHADVSHML